MVTSSSAPPSLMNMHIPSCAVTGYRTITGYRLASTVYSRLVGGKGWEGIGEGWDWGRIWDWWVLDRQIEEPLWHGGGRECGTGKGATRGKGVGPTR